MAKVREVIASTDGEIRSAKVFLQSGTTVTRPLSLLYPLEVDIPEESSNQVIIKEASKENSNVRPKREAGRIAQERLFRLLRNEQGDGN